MAVAAALWDHQPGPAMVLTLGGGRVSQDAHAHRKRDTDFLSPLHLQLPHNLPREECQARVHYRRDGCQCKSASHCITPPIPETGSRVPTGRKDGVGSHRARVPACPRARTVPGLGGRTALDPGEDDVEPHGEVHDDDADPDAPLGIAFRDAQQGDGERGLAQDRGYDGKGDGDFAEQVYSRNIRGVDVPNMPAQA